MGRNGDMTRFISGTNGMGRLTGAQLGGMDNLHPMTNSYSYGYNQAGRVVSQGMSIEISPWMGLGMTATYQWDTEGRMTSTTYPVVAWPGWGTPTAPAYAYQYDNVGRLNGMTEDLQDGNGPQGVATAGYRPAGQLLNLSYFGVSETRTYNSLLQLTRMTATGLKRPPSSLEDEGFAEKLLPASLRCCERASYHTSAGASLLSLRSCRHRESPKFFNPTWLLNCCL